MKLQKEHITPYLDCNLVFELLNYKCDYVGERYGTINGYYYVGDVIHYMFQGKRVAGKDLSLIKPLLHPMSKLNKGKLMAIGIDHEDDADSILEAIDDDSIEYIRHDLFIKLVKNHYDVFNLIPNKLADDKSRHKQA